MANCTTILAADILKDCDNSPVGGLETNAVIINRKDIDFTATTFDTNNHLLCTNLALKIGKTGYSLEGIKQSNIIGDELVVKDYGNKYTHSFNGVIINPSVANRLSLQNLVSGEEYVVVVEKKWKGVNSADAFVILGLNSGLVGSTQTYKSNENDGVEVFELKTQEGYEEPNPYLTLVETDYSTTKTAFDNKFSA